MCALRSHTLCLFFAIGVANTQKIFPTTPYGVEYFPPNRATPAPPRGNRTPSLDWAFGIRRSVKYNSFDY